MRTAIFLITIAVLVWVGVSSPIDPKRRLINRPSEHVRFSRTAQRNVKGHGSYQQAKGYNPTSPLELNLKKGEYVCGNKVCKLRPGEVPKGCNGICQYPV